MLKYKVGDLIDAAQEGEVDVIAHCCNCFCKMGSGIAPLIKKAFPYAYEADLQTDDGNKSKLGTFSLGKPMYKSQPLVFNLYGQFGYGLRAVGGRDLDYDALYDALDTMASYLKGFGTSPKVGLPLLGAGLAGGNWKIISTMIEETLVKAEIDVTIYVLEESLLPVKGDK